MIARIVMWVSVFAVGCSASHGTPATSVPDASEPRDEGVLLDASAPLDEGSLLDASAPLDEGVRLDAVVVDLGDVSELEMRYRTWMAARATRTTHECECHWSEHYGSESECVSAEVWTATFQDCRWQAFFTNVDAMRPQFDCIYPAAMSYESCVTAAPCSDDGSITDECAMFYQESALDCPGVDPATSDAFRAQLDACNIPPL